MLGRGEQHNNSYFPNRRGYVVGARWVYVQVPRHWSIPLGRIKTSTSYSPHAMRDWDEVEAE